VTAAAFFDIDGTLTRTTLAEPLLWFQQAHLPPWRFGLWLAGLGVQAPQYLLIDRFSRSRFNVAFYRRYRNLNAAGLRDWHRRTFPDNLQRRVFPAGLECVRENRRQGRAVVLVTGGLDYVMQPLAEYLGADTLMATRLVQRDGVCTGAMDCTPVADEHKAVLVRQYAAEQGIDLAASYAYGNSLGDAAMLECVGHAVAVNPDGRLRRLAGQRGWGVVRWTLGGG
jgi:HAD superfamily hydrolase (TIGR01490 family)